MAGSIVTTASDIGGGFTKYSIAWTSDGSGVVSANTLNVKRGALQQVKFVPGAGGTQPSDLYDLTITDADGIDLLVGAGANLSNSVASIVTPTAPLLVEEGAITPVIAAAGSAKTGTIILYIWL